MTPKEKAKELVDKYNFLKEIFMPSIHEQKQCALIAVDEILNKDGYNNDYWKEVKEEINKL
jgi:hypothetical protein